MRMVLWRVGTKLSEMIMMNLPAAYTDRRGGGAKCGVDCMDVGPS